MKIKLSVVNRISFYAIAILIAVNIFMAFEMYRKYDDVADANERYIAENEAVYELREASDYLTEQIRQYAITGNETYADNYNTEVNETKRREQAIDIIKKYSKDGDSNALDGIQKAMDYSVELEEIEIKAMDLKRTDPDNRQVLEYVFGDEYSAIKENIITYLDSTKNIIISEAKSNIDSCNLKFNQARINMYIALSLSGVFIIFWFAINRQMVIKPVKTFVGNINNGERMAERGCSEFRYLAAAYNHVSKLQELNREELKKEAERDGLTGLLNRGTFERIKVAMEKETISMALILIDVDNFKGINDTYGHEMGDKVLVKLSNAIVNSFRTDDYCFRVGGDEFAVIMTSINQSNIETIRRKICTINKIMDSDLDEVQKVSVSVGVAFSNGYNEDLYKKADDALYESKRNGKNTVHFSNEE